MAYEYSIGFNQFIFQINVPPNNRNLLWSLMSNEQKNEINSYVILDGYIYGPSSFFISHKIDGDEEPFEENSFAYFPFHNWPKKVYIRSPSFQIIRVKFIVDFPLNKRND